MKYKSILLILFITQATNCFGFVCEGEGFFADPDDCAKFYRCVGGTKYSFNCGPGTHFNPNCDCCDWPYNVNCQAGAGGSGQPDQTAVRYQQPSSGGQQGYSQQQYGTGQQYTAGSQGYVQPGQQVNTGSGQTYGQSSYDYSSGQQQSQSGQSYGQQLYGNSYNPQYGEPNAQLPPNYGQSGQQQPVYHQYGEYGTYGQTPGSGHRQHSTQHQSRQPQESQQIHSRQHSDGGEDTDDQSVVQQKPIRRQPQPSYPKSDRTGELSTDDHIDDDLAVNQQRVRPKTRQSQPRSRQPDNDLPEEDSEFDHKFDEPIEETTRRPKPRPRPRQEPDRQRPSPQRQPKIDNESDEEDFDRQEVVTTTRRPRVPTRKYRIKTTTAAPEDDRSDEDQEVDNEFSKFDNQENRDRKKDSDEEEVSVESNKWLMFNEDFETTSTTTTTEDPFVAILKSRVPVRGRAANRTGTRVGDRNRQFGRRYDTTTSTTPEPRTDRQMTTTADPFDKEWANFNARKDNPRSGAKPREDPYVQSSSRKRKTQAKAPADPLLMDDLIAYFNCTEAGKPCEECQELDWIKYRDIGLQSPASPFRSFKFLPKIAAKQCFKACSESQQCVAFAYESGSGMCHIYDQISADNVMAKKGSNTVVKNPKNMMVNDEWVHTRNGLITGDELYSIKTDSVMDCLRECVKDMAECLAVDFDELEGKCRVFDGTEGQTVGALKANSMSLQHMTVFDDSNHWRFEDLGYKTLANGRPVGSIRVREPEECFYECTEYKDKNCSFVTIQDITSNDNNDGSDESEVEEDTAEETICHMFGFTSTPKWIKSKSKSNHSFVLTVPRNHSVTVEQPGYTYVGNPVQILEGMTEDQCRQYAEDECQFCRKYTAIVETKECALFSDSALLSPAIHETNYTERSGRLALPTRAPEYMAFRRMPWKMFTTDLSPYEIKGEIDGHRCVEFCLQQTQCMATALVYDTADSSMFCYFFKESDLRESNLTEYENVDLFVKIMDEQEIPGHHRVASNKSAAVDCSDGRPLDDAVKNVNDFAGDLSRVTKSRSPADGDQDLRYTAGNYPLSPHGYDYYGGPQEEVVDDRESSPQKAKKYGGRAVRAADDRRQQIRHESDDNVVEDTEGPPIGNALPFIETVRQNARKESILEQLPSISSELRKRVKMARVGTDQTSGQSGIQRPKPKSSRGPKTSSTDRLTDSDCENEYDDNIGCKEDNQMKDMTKMCPKLPKIIYADSERMTESCNETRVGHECLVVCRPGYEPTVPALKCQTASGDRNVWTNWRQIKCKAIANRCEPIGDKNTKTSLVRIRSMTQYPEPRVHFFTKYNASQKLPLFSAYIHIKENNLNQSTANGSSADDSSDKYLANTCDKLADNQLTIEEYRNSDYNPSPLLPTNAFTYSYAAQSLVNTISNIAPQDPFTSRGPWMTLENRTLEMLKTRPGVVISGVCPDTIPTGNPNPNNRRQKTAANNTTINIPKCFWRVVCVPAGDDGVTAAVFYAENTHPMSQLEKQSRVDQIRQYRDQSFLPTLLGTETYRDVWLETYNAFKGVNNGIKSFIYKCAETHRNNAEGIAFWDAIINGQTANVMRWPAKFAYGLEKNDWQLRSGQQSGGQQASGRSVTARRTARNDDTGNDDETVNTIDDNNTCEDNKKAKKKIIAYLTPFGAKRLTLKKSRQLSHVILANIGLNSSGNLLLFADNNTNKDNIIIKSEILYKMLVVKTTLRTIDDHKLKTMISIGGWNQSQHFSSIVSSASKTTTLITDAIKAIEYWGLDGIEIDWKYPAVTSNETSDRQNFVTFLSQIRDHFDEYSRQKGRKERLLLSITAASGHWLIDQSYDLANIEPLVDWINVLTVDYFGPWKSMWGANTGPNAPLYASAPTDSLHNSKHNIHSTLQTYYCRLNSRADKLVMTVPFYGHYWNNVGEPIDSRDTLFRDAHPVGGFVSYGVVKNKWLKSAEFEHLWHNQSYTPYLWSERDRVFLSYENPESVVHKVKYAVDHHLGGLSLWALDFDDTTDQLFNAIVNNYKTRCGDENNKKSDIDYKCGYSGPKRWWSPEDGVNVGLCGWSAPLINGSYARCDPHSESMSCCGPWGRCGSGPEFCQCDGCVDYKRDPKALDREPTRPTQPVRWLTSDMMPGGDESEGHPVCGPKAATINGTHPTCNPDDDSGHCCSADGMCGSGADHCLCDDCVDFRRTPHHVYRPKMWWSVGDGPHRSGRCGKMAPKIGGQYPICDPDSGVGHCCNKWGLCGSGPMNCQCVGCVDFKRRPRFRWT